MTERFTSEIFTIQTQNGSKAIQGEPIGDNLLINKNGSKWTITHRHSGRALAHFYNEESAKAVATAIDMASLDWDFGGSKVPESTSAAIARLFSALCKVIKFTNIREQIKPFGADSTESTEDWIL